MTPVLELRRYTLSSGEDVIGKWLWELKDRRTRARIELRLTRLSLGQFGDCKPIDEGVWELRIDIGPGFRINYAMEGTRVLLLLGGGHKRTQSRDIARAIERWREHRRGS